MKLTQPVKAGLRTDKFVSTHTVQTKRTDQQTENTWSELTRHKSPWLESGHCSSQSRRHKVVRKTFHPTAITQCQPVEDVFQSVCGNSGKSVSARFFGVYIWRLWRCSKGFNLKKWNFLYFWVEKWGNSQWANNLLRTSQTSWGAENRNWRNRHVAMQHASLPSHLNPVHTYRPLDAGLRTDQAE